jgi:hypothetical protein
MAIGRLTLATECGDGFLLKHHERLDNRKNVPIVISRRHGEIEERRRQERKMNLPAGASPRKYRSLQARDA